MFLNMPLNFMIYVKLSSATKFGEPELRRKGWRLSTWTRVMNALCRLGHPTHRTVASMTIPLRTGLPRSVPPSKDSSMKFLRREKQRDGGDAEEAASGRSSARQSCAHSHHVRRTTSMLNFQTSPEVFNPGA